MVFSHPTKKTYGRHYAWLYSVVFKTRASLLLVLLLFLSFLIQPVHVVFATETTTSTPMIADAVLIDTEEAPVEEVDSSVQADLSTEEEIINAPQDTEEISEIETATTSDDTTATSTLPGDNDASTTTTASSSVTETPPDSNTLNTPNPIAITENNYYQFGKQACVAVGNGAYHCTVEPKEAIDDTSVVYAGNDSSGDMEIFLKTASGRVMQISDNSVDDTAPDYDPESMKIAWQRLIDGRYQIVIYDIMEEKETQLTFSKTNNMEPKIASAGIVWQAWDENDWEVMFFDGQYTDQLTHNEAQDVAPAIEDEYILWSILGTDKQQARVYSLDTKEIVTIEGHDGGSIMNPRFVLVYDTKFENGDIVTQGFDPITGLSAPISASPAPEPVKIPDVDPIGEIRALLQNKSSQKEKEVVNFDTNPPDTGTTTATSTEGALDLKTAIHATNTASEVSIVATPSTTPFTLSEYDVLIPPYSDE
jgi:hypothetical protein